MQVLAGSRRQSRDEWVDHDRGGSIWQTQTLDLENGTICFAIVLLFFCLAPVDHMSVLRLRREKLHELSSEKVQSKNKFHSRQGRGPEKGLASLAPQPSESRNLCFQPSQSFLGPAKGQFHFWGGKKPLQDTSKALRKTDFSAAYTRTESSRGETRARQVFRGYLTAPPQTDLAAAANQERRRPPGIVILSRKTDTNCSSAGENNKCPSVWRALCVMCSCCVS